MSKRPRSKRPLPREDCPECGKSVAVRNPTGGDGSAVRLPKHNDPKTDESCILSGEVVW